MENHESVMIDSDGDELVIGLEESGEATIGTSASGFYLIGPNDNNIPELISHLQRIEREWLEAHPGD